MKVKILLLLVFLFLSIGCAHRVEIYQLPPGSEEFLPSEVGILIPAILRSTDMRVNGKAIKPSEEFIRIVLQKIERTHVFLEVSSAEKSGKTKMREKAVHLELSVDSVLNINETTNQLKLVANAVTLFLFSSALPFKDDFDVTMALKTIRYDREERYYKSRIKGANSYHIFGDEKARVEARDQVVTKSLNSLMRQIMRDVDFFAMEEPWWRLDSMVREAQIRSVHLARKNMEIEI